MKPLSLMAGIAMLWCSSCKVDNTLSPEPAGTGGLTSTSAQAILSGGTWKNVSDSVAYYDNHKKLLYTKPFADDHIYWRFDLKPGTTNLTTADNPLMTHSSSTPILLVVRDSATYIYQQGMVSNPLMWKIESLNSSSLTISKVNSNESYFPVIINGKAVAAVSSKQLATYTLASK